MNDTVRTRWVPFLNLRWEFQYIGLPNGILKQKKDNEDKQKIDSTIESRQYVEYDVQNFDFLNEQEDIDEIYNSYNSEISFFTAVDSVDDIDDEAL